jgi:hypothetical protein
MLRDQLESRNVHISATASGMQTLGRHGHSRKELTKLSAQYCSAATGPNTAPTADQLAERQASATTLTLTFNLFEIKHSCKLQAAVLLALVHFC